jgi:hypothetical protein
VGVITALGLVVLGPEGLKVTLLVKLKLLDTHAVAELVLVTICDSATVIRGLGVGETLLVKITVTVLVRLTLVV